MIPARSPLRTRRRYSRGRRAPVLVGTGLIFCLVTLFGACTDTDPSNPVTCDAGEIEITFGTDPLVIPRVWGGAYIQPSFVNGCGATVRPQPSAVTWVSSDTTVVTVIPLDRTTPQAYAWSRGFGTAAITVTLNDHPGQLEVEVSRPPTEASGFTVVDSGAVGLYTTDLWVHGDYAYSGSGPWTCPTGCGPLDGWLYVWQLQPDGGLARVDSMALPAARINDIKVSDDGSLGVASQELGAPGEDGIVILDLTDPAHPAVIGSYTSGLGHVHNVWIEQIGGRDYVFTVAEGSLQVLDVTDPAAPVRVAGFDAGSSFVHDVYVRDGLAFVSHWDAGLVILDVGNGMAGGAPDDPVEVSRVVTTDGNVHNAWYWPDAAVVFVGEENFPPPSRIDEVGVVHVVDVSDMADPVEVATYGVPGSTPHNFWLDESRAILFVGWYTNGLRAIDVSGTLSGDLDGQGRELGYIIPSGFRGAGSIWAPQLHDGVIYMSDIYNGVWAVTYDG